MSRETYYCEKCNRTMGEENFYGSNNLEKYPDGKFKTCKKCMTMHVDNWNPDTYLWILQDADVPYIPDEWNKLMASYARDKSKVTGMTIIGRYLGKMKLKQFKDYRWKDTEFLQEMANNKIEQTMKRQGYDAQQIAMAINKATFEIPTEPLEEPQFIGVPDNPISEAEDYFAQTSGAQDDFNDDLTDEDRLYLRLKWGKAYKPEEWIYLEQLYNDMMESYDIQTAGHIDTLKFICKTSLKMNQLIDMGDIEGFQKVSKVYNDLMKSGKFTAAQNKAETGEFVDSVGELIELCEKEGYIERYYIEKPNDRVDFTIQDMQRYTRTLIEEETNLSNMIEMALKQNAKEDEEEKNQLDDDIVDDADLSIEELEKSLRDEDFEDFEEFKENEINNDSVNMFLQESTDI